MPGSSVDLLRRLLARRLAAPDPAEVDRLIVETFQETWAVVYTDLAGFSRGVDELGILHFLTLIHQARELLEPIVHERGGLVLKEEADSWLLLFRQPRVALDTLFECQEAARRFNLDRRPQERILLCAGLGYGPVLKIGDDDVWGREVNLASKLGEETAAEEEILLTTNAAQTLEEIPGVSLEKRQVRVRSLVIDCFSARRVGPPS